MRFSNRQEEWLILYRLTTIDISMRQFFQTQVDSTNSLPVKTDVQTPIPFEGDSEGLRRTNANSPTLMLTNNTPSNVQF